LWVDIGETLVRDHEQEEARGWDAMELLRGVVRQPATCLSACWESSYLCVLASRRAMMPMRATCTTARLLASVCS